MTDKLPPLVTPIAPPSQRPFSLSTAVSVQDVSHKQEIVEEEPYTIKCICDFVDDDGNTIYCEKCETWQHIECYYPNNVDDALREDFSHSCADCEPRSLNRQLANERQSARTAGPIVEAEATDKKAKRPPQKSHKKKPKPTELQLNGHPAAPEKHNSPHDHPHAHPPKKPKNSHKSSQSISSQVPKRSPSYGNTKVNQAHPPSPATTPPDLLDDSELHGYSPSFLSLYDNSTFQVTHTNTFARLHVSNMITAWLRDPELMKEQTGATYGDVFRKLPSDIDSRKPKIEVEYVSKVTSNQVVHWQCLKTLSAIATDSPIMELNGEIDVQSAYSAIASNRWGELLAPLPLVFFHPKVPLYIDTRKEGSKARFVRRSCKPNAMIDTFISDGRECHFWLVSDRQIAAKEQITIPWDLRPAKDKESLWLSALGLGDEETTSPSDIHIDEQEYQTMTHWIYQVLSEYGGCACDLGAECAFARFKRTYPSKPHTRPNATKEKGKKKKTKTLHAISPTSTGHATNSRAASEGHLDDVPEHDGISVSGSSRSKPPSRDMTPTARQGSFDTLGILTEPTDRDKRKVAMVEDSFRRMEQQHQPPKKRKRLSDGTTTKTKAKSSTSATVTPTLPNGFPERHYIDAGTSRSKSGSPTSAHNAVRSKKPVSRNGSVPLAPRQVSAAPSSNYKDAAVQTEPEEMAWYSEPKSTPTPKKRIVSLSERLLRNRHISRRDEAVDSPSKKRPASDESPDVMDIDSTPDRKPPSLSPSSAKDVEKHSPASVVSADHSPDVHMIDAPAVTPSVVKGVERLSTTSPTKNKSPELRVTMPPVPAFNSSPSNSATPVSAGGSAAQSPFSTNGLPSPFGPSAVNGIAPNPSPVKKKLTLSDYTKMKKAARPSVGTTSLKPVASSDEPKSAASVGAASNCDSPTNEKSVDMAAPTAGVVSTN